MVGGSFMDCEKLCERYEIATRGAQTSKGIKLWEEEADDRVFLPSMVDNDKHVGGPCL